MRKFVMLALVVVGAGIGVSASLASQQRVGAAKRSADLLGPACYPGNQFGVVAPGHFTVTANGQVAGTGTVEINTAVANDVEQEERSASFNFAEKVTGNPLPLMVPGTPGTMYGSLSASWTLDAPYDQNTVTFKSKCIIEAQSDVGSFEAELVGRVYNFPDQPAGVGKDAVTSIVLEIDSTGHVTKVTALDVELGTPCNETSNEIGFHSDSPTGTGSHPAFDAGRANEPPGHSPGSCAYYGDSDFGD